MSQIEWQQVKELFYSALNQPPAQRSDFLDSACGKDGALRSEVEVLLDSYESGFLESPVLGSPIPSGPAEPLFEPGRTFSHYSILKLLGRGGMGEVYLANDVKLDRLTAIKIIHNDSGFGDQAAGRLVREARAAAKLDHPNICSVYEVGETDGQPFIAMQYVEGDMLDALIERDTITWDDAVSYARQIAAGLAKAHSYGIVHRDIKPSNIIIDSRKHLKVLDFGLAKDTLPETVENDLSGVGLIAGTITYMSPEHARGQEISGQTDIWSLGVVFYQMLTGRLPFRGETKADLISAVLNNEFEAPSELPPAVNNVLARALEKDTEHRYHTIEELDADLARLAKGPLVKPTGLAALVYSARAGISNVMSAKARPVWRYVVPALVVLALAVGIGIWRNGASGATPVPFAAGNAGGYQIATLYNEKRSIDGAITDVSFSPNGSLIVFGLAGNEPHAVYVQQVTGGQAVRLTEGPSAAYSPVWSPDGKEIAFISEHAGKRAIWSMSPSGRDRRHLAELESGESIYRLSKWRNDGKTIFLEHGDGPREIDLESGSMTALDLKGISGKIDRGFTVSPDDSRLLVVSIEQDKEVLWVKSLDRDDARRVEEPFYRHGMPSWFPDNQRYAYSSDQDGNNQIYVRRLDDPQSFGVVTSSAASSLQPVVSPDGTKIVSVVNADEANVFTLDILSGTETAITTNVHMQLFASMSPDGRVAYQTINDPVRIRSGILNITSPHDASRDSSYRWAEKGCCANWSPTENALFYARSSAGSLDIWKSSLDGQPDTQITTVGISVPAHSTAPFDFHTSHFEVSPDGSRIAFASRRSGQDNIWTVATNGSDAQMLTRLEAGKTRAVSPIWSPDGGRIAFVEAVGGSAAYATENRIVIYANGRETLAAGFTGKVSLLSWTTAGDGVYVAVAADGHTDILLVPVMGSTGAKSILRLPDVRRFSLRISPDQKWIAYTGRRDDVDNVYIASLVGGKPRRLTNNGDPTMLYSGVKWIPDSRGLLYSKQTGGMQISLISNKQEEH